MALLIPTMLETNRLTLRRPSTADAPMHRELWAERDPRVPPHRRLAADGTPTIEDIAAGLRAEQENPTNGLLTVRRKHHQDEIGYCGFLFHGRGSSSEPELAYELLARAHGRGYATEAARAVLSWASRAGYGRVCAGVRRWNTPSLRVLAKLGFVDAGQDELDPDYGDSAIMIKTLTESAE